MKKYWKTMRANKTFRLIFVALLSLMCLTGCLRYNFDASIDESGNVTGSVLIALSKDFMAVGQNMGGHSDPSEEARQFAQDSVARFRSGSAEILPYDKDGYQGSEIQFTAISMQDFVEMLNEGGSNAGTGSYKLERQGDTYVFQVDLVKPGSQEKPQILPDEFLKTFQLSFSVAFPGPVVESNGEVSGNKVTWHPSMADHNLKALFASGKATKSSEVLGTPNGFGSVSGQNSSGGGVSPAVWIGGGSAILLVGIAGIAVFLRRRTRRF